MEPSETPEQPGDAENADPKRDRGVTEALREAVSETLAATSGSAAHTRDRAGNLIDDLVRRGREELERGRQEAGQLARRGQEATGDLARKGQEATGDLARRGQEATGGLARRGQEAGGEIARRGHEAGGEIARRGGDAREELARRFEAFEARLASIEELLRRPREPGEAADAEPQPPAATRAAPDPGAAGRAADVAHPDPSDPGTEADTPPASKPEVEG